MRIRIGQELGRNSARCARAHLPEQIGLDDCLELAVERGVEERVKLRALHPGIGLEPVHPLRAIGSAHQVEGDRKSTRLNSSHVEISYAVFCLKKKKKKFKRQTVKKKKIKKSRIKS